MSCYYVKLKKNCLGDIVLNNICLYKVILLQYQNYFKFKLYHTKLNNTIIDEENCKIDVQKFDTLARRWCNNIGSCI